MMNEPHTVDLSATLTGHGSIGIFNARATLSALFRGTGRTVDADGVYGEVDTWSKAIDPCSEPMARRVREALRQCPLLVGSTMICYRGRSLPGKTPAGDDFGPPPQSIAPANRYNLEGYPALYLCSTRDGVGRELPEAAEVWVQRFEFPIAELLIADLRSPEGRSDHLLSALMWFAELAGADGYPDRQFSRMVATLVAENFDGMLVSGVRGNFGFHYSNLVLFEPGDTWRNWLSSEQPSRL